MTDDADQGVRWTGGEARTPDGWTLRVRATETSYVYTVVAPRGELVLSTAGAASLAQAKRRATAQYLQLRELPPGAGSSAA